MPKTEESQRIAALHELHEKLAEAEREIQNGAEGEDFLAVAKKLRERLENR